MKPVFHPRGYQWEAIKFLLGRKGAGIFADPGLGKTGIVLSTLRILKKCNPNYKALIIAPLPVVINTWPEECRDWQDFEGFKTVVLHGRDKEKLAGQEADIYVLNAENIFWLFDLIVKEFDEFPFDMLVIDESTLFKNWSSKRTKVLREFRDFFDKIILLTGTPTPKGLMDMFAQMYLIDGGDSLGKYITRFRTKYFDPCGYKNKNWELREGSDTLIKKAITGNTLRIERGDVIDMPALNEIVIPVLLPPKIQKIYDEFEKKMFSEVEGDGIFIPSKSMYYNVCRQLAAGILYKPNELFIDVGAKKKIYETHTAKLDALERLSDDMYLSPLLVAYQFNFNREQIKKHAIGKRSKVLEGTDKQTQLSQYKKGFLAGEIPILAVHPASVSHGLNLHKGPGRSVVWLSPTNNLEHYIQLNDRIYRPGVGGPVNIYVLVAKNTIDEVVYSDLKKAQTGQSDFLESLSEYRRGKSSR